jgi:hypothetical protein
MQLTKYYEQRDHVDFIHFEWKRQYTTSGSDVNYFNIYTRSIADGSANTNTKTGMSAEPQDRN